MNSRAMHNTKSPMPVWLLAVLALFAVGFYIFGGAGLVDSSADRPEAHSAAPDESANSGQVSTLPPIAVAQLPPEAIDTLDLIAAGGPFPFSRDDTVFQNREGYLPDQPRGYYHEYTVITPGENDRGARRIVAGSQGELYYTSDHYQSFSEIVGVGS